MGKLKMNCGYCGRKCSLDKDFCIPQDSVYICKSCYDWKQKVDDLEAKLAESEKDLQATKESLYASREYLEELKSEKWGLEKALELAVKELDDAKDMLRECNKNEWASLLNTSVDYFKARGKEVENDRK